MVRKRLPSPAMVVAIVALVAALTGSAAALQGINSVKSNDIAANAVKSSDIARGGVTGKDIASDAVKGKNIGNAVIKPAMLDLIKVDGEVGPLVTTSATPTDLGGPSVTVHVPETGLIAIYARGTGQINGGSANALAQVHLFEANLLSAAPRLLQFDTGTPELRISTPGTGNIDGTPTPTRGGWSVFPAEAGTYTFSLRYSATGGGTATFQNTGLWAGVIG